MGKPSSSSSGSNSSRSTGFNNQSGFSTPTMPPQLMQSLLQDLMGFGGVGGIPGLGALFQGAPGQQTSAQEFGDIQMLNQMGSGSGLSSTSNAAIKDLSNFAGSMGKPSKATEAGLQEFKDLQAPGIQNWASSMGLGNSGAGLGALAQGQEQALVPLLQSDQANSLSAANSLAGIGQQQWQNKESALQNALGASGIPGQRQFQQNQERFNLGTNTQQGLMGLLSQLFGTQTGSQSTTGQNQVGNQSQGNNDWMSLLFG
jgi:hypothetical protein